MTAVLLALDTSTPAASIALFAGATLVAERNGGADLAHSRRLLSDVRDLLAGAGLTLPDVTGYAVGIGPGSFTGLRIGLATARTLAWSLGRPLWGVSSLTALALAARGAAEAAQAAILAVLDARKGEVYAALYAPSPAGGVRELAPPFVLPPGELPSRAAAHGPLLAVGTGVSAYPDCFVPERFPGLRCGAADLGWPRAAAVGQLALAAAQDGLPGSPLAVQPLYVRPSEAELHALRLADAAPLPP